MVEATILFMCGLPGDILSHRFYRVNGMIKTFNQFVKTADIKVQSPPCTEPPHHAQLPHEATCKTQAGATGIGAKGLGKTRKTLTGLAGLDKQ